jgi:hypothetical protein
MTAKQYAIFILQTGLEFGMTVYHLNGVFCLTTEEGKMVGAEIPDPDWVTVSTRLVQRSSIFEIIDNWNIKYFPSEATAEQARKEFLEIIKIEDKEVQLNEYDNWIAERSSWQV